MAPAPQPSPDPLDNGPWLKLVENCVDLFDELDSHLDHFDPSGRELAEHTCLRLQEILQRCGVELIDQPGDFDRSLHQPVEPGTGPGVSPNNIFIKQILTRGLYGELEHTRSGLISGGQPNLLETASCMP